MGRTATRRSCRLTAFTRAVRWADCKRAVAGLGAGRATVLDMWIPSAITRDRVNFWDPLHYRVAVARRIAALLGGAPGDDERVLRR